jgi:hypothetical protein
VRSDGPSRFTKCSAWEVGRIHEHATYVTLTKNATCVRDVAGLERACSSGAAWDKSSLLAAQPTLAGISLVSFWE